jgi:hypothetical protein
MNSSLCHRASSRFLVPAMLLAVTSCDQSRDLGTSKPHGPLPVDERNPIVLMNDGAYENWQGEYAVLLANGGGPPLAGIVVNQSNPWPDLDANIAGWRGLIDAARASGLRNLPDPIASIGAPLVRPTNGDIESTVPNRSEGAHLIVDTASRLSLPYRPVVVVTGGSLTDVADAYLLDRSIADKIVVVSSLGTTTESGGAMAQPNGEMDPWADTIVSSRLRFIQVSTFYDSTLDVPTSRLAELPANPLGTWMAAKQPKIWSLKVAADQVGVIAVGIPAFSTTVERVLPGAPIAAGATAGPDLTLDPAGPALLITANASTAARDRFWQILQDPKTYGN